jgi:acyl carrier protein
MDLSDFIKNFADQFENTDQSEFTAQTQFRGLEEWGSLITLAIIAMADDQYKVTLKGDDFLNSHTIQDLYDIVQSRL